MLHFLAYALLHMFFGRIVITGKPYTGKSSLWAINHSNGIVDPVVLLALAPVILQPLAKATLWNNLAMRFFLFFTRAIPVARTQDIEEMFSGRAVDPNWMKTVNAQAFQQVNKALNNGGRILIFPEGVSHDDPFLHPFKTGIARMAIQAIPDHAVIQPVVIGYSEKNEFRSNLYIHYCEPIMVTEKDTSVPELMAKVQAAFDKNFTRFENWEEKRNWQYIFKIFYGRIPDALKEFHDFVENNRLALEQDKVLMGKIQTMRCMLQVTNLSPCDGVWRKAALNQVQSDYLWPFFVVLRILSFGILTLPVLFLNSLIWAIPLEICEILGTKKKYNRDVYATMKIAHAMWVFPVWSIGVVWVITIFTKDYFPMIHPVLLGCLFFILAPLLLLLGHFISAHMNFGAGYFRYGLLKVTFPRGLEEMLWEWKEIAGAIIQKIKVKQ